MQGNTIPSWEGTSSDDKHRTEMMIKSCHAYVNLHMMPHVLHFFHIEKEEGEVRAKDDTHDSE